jgi:multidrug efflux pump subunit AcrB
LVNVLSVFILIVGAITLWGLQKEIFPKIDFDIVVISTVYPGSSPEDVEKLVSIPIERSLKGVGGIKELNSMSSEGLSTIYVEIDPDFDIDDVFSDIKNAVDTVNDFPEDVERPIILQPDSKMRGVITIALDGKNIPYKELRKASRLLRDRLEREKVISRVQLGGYLQDEIRVIVNLDKSNRFELTIGEIAQAIQGRNLNLSAGKLEVDNREIFIRTVAEFLHIEDIANIVIRSNSTGRKIRIKDVAKVVRVPMKAKVIERSSGERAIFLSISINEKADIIKSVNKIRKVTDEFLKGLKVEKRIEVSISHNYINDLSYYVKRRLNVLKNNGFTGLLLVFLALMLFLNFKTSVITSLGAPIAFMLAFIFMDASGMTLNLITMFALILVLGMLVDDSIIVAEQFYQNLEKGMSSKEAAKQAAWETFYPVLATVLTTVVAFSALFFMGGMMGKFLWPVPVIVIIALLGSLFECFVLLPSHLADFVKFKKAGVEKTRWYQPILNLYKKTLQVALRFPWITLFLFVIWLVGSISLVKKMRFELFPGDDVRIAYLFIKGPVGVTLERTNQEVMKLEQVVLNRVTSKELKNLISNVGKLEEKRSTKKGNQYGQVVVFLTEPTERERSTDEILVDITTEAKKVISTDYELSIRKVQGGPPKGKAFEIEFAGDRLSEVLSVAMLAKKSLDQIEGGTSSTIDYETGKEQIIVDIDDSEARRLGLSTRTVAKELRIALGENALTEIRENDEDVDVKIFLANGKHKGTDILEKIFVLNNQGRRIRVSRVAKFKKVSSPFVIRRKDRKRIISLAGTLDKRVISPLKLVKQIKPKVNNILQKYDSIIVSYGGENRDTRESMQGLLKSALISLGMIFFILIVMFSSLAQPLIVCLQSHLEWPE